MSYAHYATDLLAEEVKNELRECYDIAEGAPGHMVFIDHHDKTPTCFPSHVLCVVDDKPDLLGVYYAKVLVDAANQIIKPVPHQRHHHIENLAEINHDDGREQVVSYIYRNHQARPDRLCIFALYFRPDFYQLVFSNPLGTVASPTITYDNLLPLCQYIYSLYLPPDDIYLVDKTLKWHRPVGKDTSVLPTWSVKFQGQWYTGGEFVFIGSPWTRFTKVMRFKSPEEPGTVIMKEQFRGDRRRFKEEDILQHIHLDGDVPGVVRLQGYEEVHASEETQDAMKFTRDGEQCTKIRMFFDDDGDPLESATSVNQLLKAVFDALEGE